MSRVKKYVPWTAEEELWARRIVTLDCILFWALLIGSGSVFLHKAFVLGALMDLLAFGWAWLLFRDRRRLMAMLQNKPRSTVELTQWIRMRPYQAEICCACGAQVHISSAMWYPNSIDPGGGRFAIVCACGIGYFKLKAEGEK